MGQGIGREGLTPRRYKFIAFIYRIIIVLYMSFMKYNKRERAKKRFSIREIRSMHKDEYVDEVIFSDEVSQETMIQYCRSIPSKFVNWSLDVDFLKNNIQIEENLEVRLVNSKIGYGVFAKKAIPNGCFIGEYTGVLRTMLLSDYAFGFHHGGSIGVDALEKGNFTRYINHNTKGNLIVYVCAKKKSCHIVFFTNRFIRKGEQLTYNYGPDYWSKDERREHKNE